jgi:hypothetical protein
MHKSNGYKPTDRKRNELKKAVKNYNAKISYNEKKGNDFMPEKQKFKDILKSVSNTTEINKVIADLKKFSQKGQEKPIVNKNGITLTAYEAKKFDKTIKSVNKKREKQAEEEKTKTLKGENGQTITAEKTIKEQQNKPVKKVSHDNFKSLKEFHEFLKWGEKELLTGTDSKRNEQYKTNYLKSLDTVFGGYPEMYKKLKKAVNGFTTRKFIEIYQNEALGDINYLYFGGDELKDKFDNLIEIFARYS